VTFRTYYPSDLNAHPSMPAHPERACRIQAALGGVARAEIGPRDFSVAPKADIHVALALHEDAYIQSLTTQFETNVHHRLLDGGDTHQTRSSLDAALSGVGAACTAIDSIVASDISGAFVATRPPGHHACKSSAMGFCLLGTAALAAAHAKKKHGFRVAVLDFDLHHGNGTEDLLWDEPDIFFASTLQQGIWPMTGDASSHGAFGQIMNVPLAAGSGSFEMRKAWLGIFKRVRAWKADMIIASAGFDAHADDPLSGLNWTIDDYAWLGAEINALAAEVCQGRVVSILEGGYDLSVLTQAIPAYLETVHKTRSDDAGIQGDICNPFRFANGSPYISPSLRPDDGDGFTCVKAFSRLWIQNRKSWELIYTPPEFLRLTNRRGLAELAERATNSGYLCIDDVVDFEHGLKRALGFRQRSSMGFHQL